MRPFLFLFLLLIPLASALFGGESYTKHFDKCYNLSVRIEGNLSIDDEEFLLNNECYNISDNHEYICPCHNDYDFTLTTKVNTINYYTLTFNYNYTEEESSSGGNTNSGGGSSSSSSDGVNCAVKAFINTSYCIKWCERYALKNNCYDARFSNHLCCKTYYPKNESLSTPIKKEVVQDNEQDVIQNLPSEDTAPSQPLNETEEPEAPKKDNSWIWVIVIVVGLAIILGGVMLWVWFGGGE